MKADLDQIERSWVGISDVLRVPQTDADYDELNLLLDQLIDKIGDDESHPLITFMDVVAALVEKYNPSLDITPFS
jgi:HTH-type transcriptional regulator / antitoxin HigA